MRNRRARTGRINFIAVVLIVAAIAAITFIYRFGPYYWDYWKMKEITKTTALQWKVYSKKAAEEKLRHMVSPSEFGDDYIEADLCHFEDGGKRLTVWCAWEVDVYYPFSENIKTLSFSTEHTESMDGS